MGCVERREAAERAHLGRRRIDRLLDHVEMGTLAGELEVGDASRHRRPGGVQPTLIDGGRVRCGFQLLRRLGLRPPAGHPVNPKRHPLALGHQRLDGHRHTVGRRVELGDLGGGLHPQGAERKPLRRVGERRRAMLVSVKDEEEKR